MLEIKDAEMKEIDSFLSLLSTNFDSIDYIAKGNQFYETKSADVIQDVLTFLLLTNPSSSEVNLEYHASSETISIHTRIHGSSINPNLAMSKQDNFETVSINNIAYSTIFLKKCIDCIISREFLQKNFLDIVSVPLCGLYKIRSSTRGNIAICRLIKLEPNRDNDIINYNWLQLDTPITYTINIDIHDDELVDTSIYTLPELVKKDIYEYINAFDLFINHFENKSVYKTKKIKVILEFKDNKITPVVHVNYLFLNFNNGPETINYIKNHADVFYKPVFKKLIEKILNDKIELGTGYFNTPQDFKNYLLTCEMMKI